MALYGIWEPGRKIWWDCSLELGNGKFTQHRNLAQLVLVNNEKDSIPASMIEEWALSVCALGDDGLPLGDGDAAILSRE